MHTQYVAFLRGINVSGHHKVPMSELKELLNTWGFTGVTTLLNSGNILFTAPSTDIEPLEVQIESNLTQHFGFPIPTIIRSAQFIQQLNQQQPFEQVVLTKQIRRYISFLKVQPTAHMPCPWQSEDGSFEILQLGDREILSVLDLAKAHTPQAMEVLERHYGKDITTRNWNTIERVVGKL